MITGRGWNARHTFATPSARRRTSSSFFPFLRRESGCSRMWAVKMNSIRSRPTPETGSRAYSSAFSGTPTLT
jgi:hypothetical protein